MDHTSKTPFRSLLSPLERAVSLFRSALKRKCPVTVLGLALIGCPGLHSQAADSAGNSAALPRANYSRPFEPAARAAFLALPPGAVEPSGWLRDWCVAAREGFTGHMDEYDEEFKRAWSADHKMTGERLDWPKGGWPYEGGGYWFDGLAKLGYILHDEELIAQARRRLDAVVTNMNSQAILFLWWLNRDNPADRNGSVVSEAWPMWANGLLGRSLAGYYLGSGDKRVLAALEAGYSGDPDWLRLGWAMSNPWPALDTWTWTGNPQIAAGLTALFSKEGGGKNPGGGSWNRYRQKPDPSPGKEASDHVVHFLESTTPWALGYLWTGNREFLETALAWHDLLEREAMQPSGVPVADEYFGPTGAFRGTETCDVAAYLWSQITLLTVSGEGRLGDRAERNFFNAAPVTVARDFKTHVYFQTPNRVVDKSPPHPHGPQAEGNSYKRKHFPLCCTAALNRIAPNYVMHMWMATHDNGLAATHYGPCTVSAKVADGVPVKIVCRTDYPFDDLITMTVTSEKPARFPLSFRIPGWCKTPSINVNGEVLTAIPDAKGFVRVERTWNPGDTIRFRFPMTATVQVGRDRNAQGAPYASVSYGPLLFALPIPDSPDHNTPESAARWRYALDVQHPELSVERSGMPTKWNWPLAAPLKLRVRAVEIGWSPDPKAPKLPQFPMAAKNTSEEITLVPFGSTRFRISMFPVTAAPEVRASDIRRILFLGNSITLHGPKEDIGWHGNWGMAASAAEKDYVHLVANALGKHTGSKPKVMVRNIADFERSYAAYDTEGQLKECLEFDADLVVLAIGENVPALGSDEAKAQFRTAVARILSFVMARRHPLVVVRSSFLPDPGKDQALRLVCEEAGAVFVDAGRLSSVPENIARSERSFTHEGVAGHPGDRGMKALADAIVDSILQRGAKSQ